MARFFTARSQDRGRGKSRLAVREATLPGGRALAECWRYLPAGLGNLRRRLSIYGSPWQPEFMHWAFNVPRGQLTKYWKQIPAGLDILITHGPPFGILDQRVAPGVRRHASWEAEEPFAGSDHIGDEELLTAVEKVKPRVHVFGHIHSGYGTIQNRDTTFYNASLCDEDYEPIHEPWVIDLLPQK